MTKQKHTQRGSALIYILIAIALLGALTATFMDSSSQQTSSQNSFNAVTELSSQANFIRSAIQECILTYPAGDAGLVGTANTPYPLMPTNAYMTPMSPAISFDEIRSLRCPGNPGDSANHVAIFGGASGKFMPPAPNLFDNWLYYTGADGVFYYTKTNKTDAYLVTALNKLDDQFSECEADVINAASPSAAQNLTSAGASGPVCAAGYYCFRVWILSKPGKLFPGDTDGDELAATCASS